MQVRVHVKFYMHVARIYPAHMRCHFGVILGVRDTDKYMSCATC